MRTLSMSLLSLLFTLGTGCVDAGNTLPDVDPDAGDHEENPLPPGPPLGEPITIAPEQKGEWVWISMEEMTCSDGSPGGFAVNFTDASRDVVVYLQGGGICYDWLSCMVGGAPTSVGSDPLQTALDRSIREHRGIFDREDPTNPLRDANFVVVPHCTGDHHTGDTVSSYSGMERHHRGYSNMTRVMERVVPTFKDAGRVVLSGFSAGGVGITANYHQLAEGFESVGLPPPFLMIDAGPFMRTEFLKPSAQATLRANWALDETIGKHCPSCLTEGFHALYRTNALLHPGLRSSLICADADSVVRTLYSLLNGSGFGAEDMIAGMEDLAAWNLTFAAEIAPSTHRTFIYGGSRHGALNVAPLSESPGLSAFLEAQLAGGDWENVRIH